MSRFIFYGHYFSVSIENHFIKSIFSFIKNMARTQIDQSRIVAQFSPNVNGRWGCVRRVPWRRVHHPDEWWTSETTNFTQLLLGNTKKHTHLFKFDTIRIQQTYSPRGANRIAKQTNAVMILWTLYPRKRPHSMVYRRDHRCTPTSDTAQHCFPSQRSFSRLFRFCVVNNVVMFACMSKCRNTHTALVRANEPNAFSCVFV